MDVEGSRGGFVERLFGLRAAGVTIGGELNAALTTFLTMAYILVVNPAILSEAIQLPGGASAFPQLLTATALAAAFGTLLMGLLARYPFAVAPGMGLNAYFTYTVVLGQGVPWQTALGAVFISGVGFLFLSVAGVRTAVVRAIPRELRIATGAGIGLFLAIIGARNAGLVVDHPATLLTLGDVTSPGVLLAVLGLVVTVVLLALRVRAALVVGIAAVTGLAILLGAPVYAGGQVFSGFADGVVRAPAWPVDVAFALDLGAAVELGLVGIVFTFLFVDLFDTAGTLIGLADKAGVLDDEGSMPRASAAFASDALATAFGALAGTSTTTSYIESASGIEAGGRTGLVSVFVAAFFAASLFLWPLLAAIPAVATAPALIVVGAMMMHGVGRIDWSDHRVSVPAFVTMVGMPLTFSIANGIAFGIIGWTVIHAASGRARRVHWIVYTLTALLILRYGWLASA